MARAMQVPPARAGVTFELEEFDLRDGRLLVSGWWSGVRGLRFVRPTLLAEGREVLATLEHKPWAPGGEAPWTAAFPWTAGVLAPAEAALAVAPSVVVPVAPGGPAEARLREEAKPPPAPPPAPSVELIGPAPSKPTLGREAGAVRERDELRAERDAAVRDRDAAVRERDAARAERDAAVGDREDAVRERDDALEQREDALLAHRTAERLLHEERAARRAEAATPPPPTSAPQPPAASPAADRDEDPIGVRSVPAPSSIAAGLRHGERDRSRSRDGDLRLSPFDLWAIRILGSIAAICFILLLVMTLRVVV